MAKSKRWRPKAKAVSVKSSASAKQRTRFRASHPNLEPWDLQGPPCFFRERMPLMTNASLPELCTIEDLSVFEQRSAATLYRWRARFSDFPRSVLSTRAIFKGADYLAWRERRAEDLETFSKRRGRAA